MGIETTHQLNALENTINRCRHFVWMDSVQERGFELKAGKSHGRKVKRLQPSSAVLVGNWLYYPNGWF